MEFSQIGEKVFYTVTFETEQYRTKETLELLTGDFNDSNYDAVLSGLEYVQAPESRTDSQIDSIIEAVLSEIRDNWDSPGNLEFDEIEITIDRQETESEFSHSGCDLCRDGLGNNVYSCIGYNDASEIKNGQYWDIDVCGDCLCSYHNGD